MISPHDFPNNTKFYIITNEGEDFEGYMFRDGMNICPRDITDYDNGFTFFEEGDVVYNTESDSIYIREVELYQDSMIQGARCSYVVDKLFLHPRCRIEDSPIWDKYDDEDLLHVVLDEETDEILHHVPPRLCTEHIYCTIVMYDNVCYDIPERLMTPCVHIALAHRVPWHWEDIPNEMKTPEFCEKAIADGCEVLSFIPKEIQTHEMYENYVKWHGCIKEVPESHRTTEMYANALRQSIDTIDLIPSSYWDRHMVETLVKNHFVEFELIPDEYIDQDLCNLAYENKHYPLNTIPKKFITQEMCDQWIKRWAYYLQTIPAKFRSKELCLHAVKNWSLAIKHIPKRHQTEEIYMCHVKSHNDALYLVPTIHRTLNVCIEAVRHCMSNYPHVPENLWPDIKKHFKNNKYMLRVIKDHIH